MLPECKICGREVPHSRYMEEIGICDACGIILNCKVESIQEEIGKCQNAANAASSPDERIKYLKLMLDILYEYKVKYYDNDVDVLEQNVEDLIDTVVDCISEAKI
ncbi:hypothetical protein FL966_01600 [Caproiciproducens galactitolivorans]|uniref:Uncharacterized protein n=1 Tax=Caproiciproducens galactitolivorans TaxID=642589 RepID=A0A4Z0XYG4_9FIRM|nr:hypothetical protein [Caproiciproducens galactitolivorans]QEY33841.1 hypothetical protein FL966_01600 [Caproiciproducens galactitolivorans]TGJ75537.1 hypothetical protein CAGA_23370 [Caproiciproducens galactitolivorans]